MKNLRERFFTRLVQLLCTWKTIARKTMNEKETPAQSLSYIKYLLESLSEDPFYKLKISIKTEKSGWILHRKALQIQRRLHNVHINKNMPNADLHYYINYGYMHSIPSTGVKVANFTHFDPKLHGDKFIDAAKAVDHCVAVCDEVAFKLFDIGIPEHKVTVIPVGADSALQAGLDAWGIRKNLPRREEGGGTASRTPNRL